MRSDGWLDLLSNMDSVVFFLAFFSFLYFLIEKCGCSKYEPRRQELLTLLRRLRDETTSEDAHEIDTAQRASSPIFMCR